MKYLGACGLMILCNEVTTLIALTLIVSFVICDIVKARCER